MGEGRYMDRQKNNEKKKTFRRVATVSAAGSLALLLSGCTDEGPKENTSQQVCGDELDTREGMVVVDGRCDTDPTAPIGVYTGPDQSTRAFATATTGAELFAYCVTEGEPIQDLSGEGGTQWVQIDSGRSQDNLDFDREAGVGDGPLYIPGAWVDGEQGLKACQ